MKIPFFSTNKSIAIPEIEINPSWYLAWGKIDNVEGVAWRDRSFVICNASPAFSPQQQFVAVGDIWLSNKSQLLQRLDVNWQEITDIQIVAALWERWGNECIMLLEGMFAMAVWDRECEELWLVRDRIGFRTLYYTTPAQTRFIAPRLRTLANRRSNDLDLIAMRDYLCCAFVPGNRTLWQQVRELSAGTFLQFSTDTIQVYWQVKEQVTALNEPIEWHGKKLRSLLDLVVREYLPVDEPVGIFLSGGLDSSSITALAAKLHTHRVHTYSIHFGSECPNELEFSSLVAEHCQTQHHILEITPADMWEQLPKTMAHLDDPIGDPLTVPNLLVAQLAHGDVNIILNGEGGDPCFGGPKNKPMLLNSLYSSVALSQQDWLLAYLNSFQKCSADLPRLLAADVWAIVKNETFIYANDLNSVSNYLSHLMLLNIKYKGADQILTKVNNLTTAAGLQGRSPLFDQRIVELSLQIPPEYKLDGADEKAVLKNAVADLLPSTIIKRPKSGMMVPVQKWFRDKWRSQAKALLLDKKAAIAPYLNQSLIQSWLDYRGDSWSRYGVKLWLLASLEIWLQVNKSR